MFAQVLTLLLGLQGKEPSYQVEVYRFAVPVRLLPVSPFTYLRSGAHSRGKELGLSRALLPGLTVPCFMFQRWFLPRSSALLEWGSCGGSSSAHQNHCLGHLDLGREQGGEGSLLLPSVRLLLTL